MAAYAAPAFAGIAQRPPVDREQRPSIDRDRPALGDPQREGQRAERTLNERFADLRRHFVFEYYPWYAASPYIHWNQDGRVPPIDVASNYMPLLGPYDSRDTRVIEQHAKWIADVGVGAINVSWWGPGDFTDRVVPTLMDVMADHDVHVTFHLEPYTNARAFNYARDIQYLITQYGDRRHWDCFLLVQHADGTVGPVFKSFATIVPPTSTDCRGVVSNIPIYAPTDVWRRQTDTVRQTFVRAFDRITLLADSLAVDTTRAAGFDGIAIYDNYVEPDSWTAHANGSSSRDLVFSFNTNPGFDGLTNRDPNPGPCFSPQTFEPGRVVYDWTRPGAREAAATLAEARIRESFRTTLRLQLDPHLANVKHGFFLTYINSFNEWHEGHQFEPMKNASALSPQERAIAYHNPEDGMYRLRALQRLLGELDL